MARHAARIALDRAELLIAAGAIESRRLEAHRVDIGPRRAEPFRFVFDGRDQLRSKAFAAHGAIHPEQLDVEHRGPELSNDAADDLVAVTERHSDALVALLAHLLRVISAKPAEHHLPGRTNDALD